MGEVVTFRRNAAPAVAANPGNGARDALVDYITNVPCPSDTADNLADHMLIWLWSEGFMLVPVDDG